VNIDGKKIAEEILYDLSSMRNTLKPVIKLGVLMQEGNKAVDSFVRIKERAAERLRVAVVREILPAGASTEEALTALKRLCKSADGVIVQLPLPSAIDTNAVLKTVPPKLDVDALGPAKHFLQAPVVEAISDIFVRTGISARGKKAVVIGAGRLVGAPVAQFLRGLTAHVVVITDTHGSLEELYDADIVVSGAGVPGLIEPQMLKKGVVLIDAGTSEASGKLMGDATPACAQVTSVFTPVPGGLGPIVVAMLFKNLFTLVGRAKF
jgi:methylenetetrahydrofolate dehydrogenase (NADP+)/methenyltetrahydrofolate cyclohydrolase